MEPKPLSLEFQHPACHDCQWHLGALQTLTALLRKGIPISEATIKCTPMNTSHATVQADAYSEYPDKNGQNHFVLIVDADLYCVRRGVDPSFATISDDID